MSCLTLWYTMDCSPPCSSVHGNSQARKLEWVSISISGDLPDPGIQPLCHLLHWQANSLPLSHQGNPKAFLQFGKFVTSSLGGSDRREWSCYTEHNYVYQQLWKASSYCSVNKTVYRVWLRDKWLIVLDNTMEKARFCIFFECKICFWLKLWWQTI